MEDRRILIDTSVVIDHFRKKNKHKSLLYELAKENILFLSAISKFEFLVGAKPKQIRKRSQVQDFWTCLCGHSNSEKKPSVSEAEKNSIGYCSTWVSHQPHFSFQSGCVF